MEKKSIITWIFIAGIGATAFAAGPTGVGITFEAIGVACFVVVAVMAYFEGRKSGKREAEGVKYEAEHGSSRQTAST